VTERPADSDLPPFQVVLRVLEILLPVAQVSHQKVQVRIVWRQLVSGGPAISQLV